MASKEFVTLHQLSTGFDVPRRQARVKPRKPTKLGQVQKRTPIGLPIALDSLLGSKPFSTQSADPREPAAQTALLPTRRSRYAMALPGCIQESEHRGGGRLVPV